MNLSSEVARDALARVGVLELFSGEAVDMLNEPTSNGARKIAELQRDAAGAWSGPALADSRHPMHFARMIEDGIAVAAFGIDMSRPVTAGQIAQVALVEFATVAA